jgi:hypothetical protein
MQQMDALDDLPIAELLQRFKVKNDSPPAKTAKQTNPLKKRAFSQPAMWEFPDLDAGIAAAHHAARMVRVSRPDVQINDITLGCRYHFASCNCAGD